MLHVKYKKIARTNWFKANGVCNRKWNIRRRKSEVHYSWNRYLHPSIKSSLHYKFILTQHAKCHSVHVAAPRGHVHHSKIWRLWFRESLIYINNCPKRCNTKQSIYCSANSLYMFRVLTTPIIRSTQNCNYSLRFCAATSLQRSQAWPRWREVVAKNITTHHQEYTKL